MIALLKIIALVKLWCIIDMHKKCYVVFACFQIRAKAVPSVYVHTTRGSPNFYCVFAQLHVDSTHVRAGTKSYERGLKDKRKNKSPMLV